MGNYTKSNTLLSDEAFATWAWFQLSAYFTLIVVIGMIVETNLGDWFLLGLMLSVPLIFVAWLLAKRKNSIMTLVWAVLLSIVANGFYVGFYTYGATRSNLIDVLIVAGAYAFMSGILAGQRSDVWVSMPSYIYVPALIAGLPAYLFLRGFVWPSVLELVVYVYIVVASILDYRRAWKVGRTVGNAIGFSVEFAFWPINWLIDRITGSFDQ
jgi:hypothetical protein